MMTESSPYLVWEWLKLNLQSGTIEVSRIS